MKTQYALVLLSAMLLSSGCAKLAYNPPNACVDTSGQINDLLAQVTILNTQVTQLQTSVKTLTAANANLVAENKRLTDLINGDKNSDKALVQQLRTELVDLTQAYNTLMNSKDPIACEDEDSKEGKGKGHGKSKE